MKIAIYIRVSTEDQDREEYSPDLLPIRFLRNLSAGTSRKSKRGGQVAAEIMIYCPI